MIRMPFEDGEGTVELFQQNNAGKLVGQGHFAKRKQGRGRTASMFSEAIRAANPKSEGLGTSILMITDKLGEFFRGKLFPAGIEEY